MAFWADAWKLTALYVALNALIMLVLSMLVVRSRVATGTEIGHGDSAAMLRAVRAHGNTAENVPMPLLMMIIVTALGGSLWLVHAVGAPLTIGRILHGVALSRSTGPSLARFLGMVLTWIAFIAGIAALVWLVFNNAPTQG